MCVNINQWQQINLSGWHVKGKNICCIKINEKLNKIVHCTWGLFQRPLTCIKKKKTNLILKCVCGDAYAVIVILTN